MRFAIADPPYLTCSVARYGDHPDASVYDTIEGHRALIAKLLHEYDGWALCMTSGNLWDLLPELPRPPACRIGAWVKPFATWKKNVGVTYAWEPVVFFNCRKHVLVEDGIAVKDWVAANISMQTLCCGAKPAKFTRWVLDVLNVKAGDTVDDLFYGSGAVSAIIAERLRNKINEGPLFDLD
jgi:hypothetical protein